MSELSSSSMSPEAKAAIAPVLGRVPSGVFILVAGDASGAKTGLMASWVQQASFDPPQITVAVNKSRYLNPWLCDGAAVTLNQIAKGDSVLFRHFGKGFEPGADAFAGLDADVAGNGLPVLKSALCSLEGRVSGRMECGDHMVYLITLTQARSNPSGTTMEPFVHIRKNGFGY